MCLQVCVWCLIFPGALAGPGSSGQTIRWAPGAQTPEGMVLPLPPILHANRPQESRATHRVAITVRRADPVVAGAEWAPTARWAGTALAVAHQPAHRDLQ